MKWYEWLLVPVVIVGMGVCKLVEHAIALYCILEYWYCILEHKWRK